MYLLVREPWFIGSGRDDKNKIEFLIFFFPLLPDRFEWLTCPLYVCAVFKWCAPLACTRTRTSACCGGLELRLKTCIKMASRINACPIYPHHTPTEPSGKRWRCASAAGGRNAARCGCGGQGRGGGRRGGGVRSARLLDLHASSRSPRDEVKATIDL